MYAYSGEFVDWHRCCKQPCAFTESGMVSSCSILVVFESFCLKMKQRTTTYYHEIPQGRCFRGGLFLFGVSETVFFCDKVMPDSSILGGDAQCLGLECCGGETLMMIITAREHTLCWGNYTNTNHLSCSLCSAWKMKYAKRANV